MGERVGILEGEYHRLHVREKQVSYTFVTDCTRRQVNSTMDEEQAEDNDFTRCGNCFGDRHDR